MPAYELANNSKCLFGEQMLLNPSVFMRTLQVSGVGCKRCILLFSLGALANHFLMLCNCTPSLTDDVYKGFVFSELSPYLARISLLIKKDITISNCAFSMVSGNVGWRSFPHFRKVGFNFPGYYTVQTHVFSSTYLKVSEFIACSCEKEEDLYMVYVDTILVAGAT